MMILSRVVLLVALFIVAMWALSRVLIALRGGAPRRRR